MTKHTYPMITILNEETKLLNGYVVDLAIFCEGKTQEDVYAETQTLVTRYITLAQKYEAEIPPPSGIDTVKKKWPGYAVSTVTVSIK